jgi:hypothetical protein
LATISVVVHQELDLTERIVEGELTMADVMLELKLLYGAPITKRVMWDLSATTFSSLDSAYVEQISAAAAPLVKTRVGGRSAVLATSDLAYGYSRMYQAYRDMNEVSVPFKSFRVREEAIEWLMLAD